MRIIRSVITSVIEGAIKLFSGTGLSGETFTEREFFQHFGLTSIPPAGSEGIVFVIGNRVFMLASDNRDLRPPIEDGEACLYIDKLNWIKIKADKTIHIKTENKVVVEAAADVEVTAAGNATVNANNISATAAVQADITAPVVNIIAATSVLVQSPVISLGVSGFLALVTSAFVALFNNHTHSGGPPPDVPAVIGIHTTVNTLAS